MWNLVRSVKSGNSKHSIPVLKNENGDKVTSDCYKAELPASSLDAIQNRIYNRGNPSDIAQKHKKVNQVRLEQSQNMPFFHPFEFRRILKNLKTKKAPGWDKTSNIVLKNLSKNAVPHQCLNIMEDQC